MCTYWHGKNIVVCSSGILDAMNWCGKNIVVCSSGVLDAMIVCVPISMVKILQCAVVASWTT